MATIKNFFISFFHYFTLLMVIIKKFFTAFFHYSTLVTVTVWSFGFLAAVFLVSQLTSGIFLTIHYSPVIAFTFESVHVDIMQKVWCGNYVCYFHSTGASMLFLALYSHIGRNIYNRCYGYCSIKLWLSGMLIYVLLMLSAFVGYVLPWDQVAA